IEGRWSLTARYSRLSTDGYRDQSWVEMWNAYLSLTRFGERSRLRLVFFGGPERTHLAYEGVPQRALKGSLTGDRERDRRFNPITYPGEIDTFMQPHYQLIHELDLASGGTLAQTLYAYQGEGSYDQFRANRHLNEYNLPDIIQPDGSLVTRTDLVRRRNVAEWDYGWVPTLTRDFGRLTWSVGGEVRAHRAHHWGEVTWARSYPPDSAPDRRYYDYRVDKDSGTVTVAATWRPHAALTFSSGLQLTRHRYRMHDDLIRNVAISEPFTFVLPRLGAVIRLGEGGEAHVNLARGMREPNFRDI
ncbi:MAG: TonB-dependent receptor, partial [Acidobacteria bacterium]|nr:TonB-dependent receptor [Acidobacteriota bacterium]